eukprot:3043300-Ditylum_brightwellii.AAC.1
MNPGTQDGMLNNTRVICFEWTPGITLRNWMQFKQHHLDLSVPTGSLTGYNDNNMEDRNRRYLMSYISLAYHITKALAEIHEVGVVLNNLSVDHILINETQCNEENCDNDSCITVHL